MIDPMRISSELADWIEKSDWAETYGEFLEDFFADYAEMTGLDAFTVLKDLTDEVAIAALAVAEDHFATRRYETDAGEKENVVDAYLQQGAPEESRPFLVALRDSRPGLFEVVEVGGETCTLRNLLEPKSEPVAVSDALEELDPQAGDTLFARIVSVGDIHHLAAGTLDLTEESRNEILEMFEEAVKEYLREVPKLIRKDPTQARAARSAVLDGLPPIATALWIEEVRALAGGFENSPRFGYRVEGENSEIVTALDGEFQREAVQAEPMWTVADGEYILAGVMLLEGILAVTVADESLIDQVEARLRGLLGDRLGPERISTV